MIDRRPALIARCAGVADVIAAVRFARTHGLLVSVKGGGHNITGNAVCEGGLMIDLSPMKGIRVDPVQAHRARPGRAHLGRVQSRDAGFRPRHHRRRRLDHRHRRADPGRRSRLADGQARPELRQPAVGRHRHRRWRVPDRQRRAAPGAVLGAARRRRQFRGRHLVRIPASSGHPVLAGMVVHPMAKAREVLRFYREFCARLPRRDARRGGADDVARGRRRSPSSSPAISATIETGERADGAAAQIRLAAGGHDRADCRTSN